MHKNIRVWGLGFRAGFVVNGLVNGLVRNLQGGPKSLKSLGLCVATSQENRFWVLREKRRHAIACRLLPQISRQ